MMKHYAVTRSGYLNRVLISIEVEPLSDAYIATIPHRNLEGIPHLSKVKLSDLIGPIEGAESIELHHVFSADPYNAYFPYRKGYAICAADLTPAFLDNWSIYRESKVYPIYAYNAQAEYIIRDKILTFKPLRVEQHYLTSSFMRDGKFIIYIVRIMMYVPVPLRILQLDTSMRGAKWTHADPAAREEQLVALLKKQDPEYYRLFKVLGGWHYSPRLYSFPSIDNVAFDPGAKGFFYISDLNKLALIDPNIDLEPLAPMQLKEVN